MPKRQSHRRVALFAVLPFVALVAALPGSLSVGAASVPPASLSLTADQSAEVTEQAQRLRPLPPENFPLQPTPKCNILDNFGAPRSGGRSHEGSDMLATLGQEVYAMADGKLTYQSYVGDGKAGSLLSGNLWKLTSGDGTGTYYIYAHLSQFAPGLAVGSTVFKGQVLGYVGDTGNAGPGNYHLHFELHPNGGAAVNPLPLLTIPAACKVYT